MRVSVLAGLGHHDLVLVVTVPLHELPNHGAAPAGRGKALD
ncbi:hypothetical protein [Amycolatopsis sp. FDAARGOS 1241]|nr:hypothetical protein [Amycolatopsis sp. FDAARGOS 1241]